MKPWKWACLLMALAAAAWAQDDWVTVDSTPPRAMVYDNTYYRVGQDAGYVDTTPFSIQRSRLQGKLLWFVLDGYVRTTARLETGRSRLEVTLQPATPWGWLSFSMRYRPAAALLALALVGGLGGAVAWRVHARIAQLKHRVVEAETRPPTLAGRVLGDYEVLELLGEGSFSQVYRVRHLRYRDEFAMKVLRSQFFDPSSLERFRREMELEKVLHHKNIVRIFDYGEFDGQHCIIMELLSGRTLRRLIQDQPPNPSQAVGILVQICEGLDAAHRKGIVHRDLKPDNVMVGTDDTVHIMDFGIAKFLDRTRMTASGAALGTPSYMSPEHVDSELVDPRSDIYSLGVIAYELATGQLPFTGRDPVEVIVAHLKEDPVPPREIVPHLSERLESAIMRMLEKNPQDRYQSASEIVRDLEALRLQ